MAARINLSAEQKASIAREYARAKRGGARGAVAAAHGLKPNTIQYWVKKGLHRKRPMSGGHKRALSAARKVHAADRAARAAAAEPMTDLESEITEAIRPIAHRLLRRELQRIMDQIGGAS